MTTKREGVHVHGVRPPDKPTPTPPDDVGVTVSDGVHLAFAAMRLLTDEQRMQVTCWFCSHCGRYEGPGDCCRCWDDS